MGDEADAARDAADAMGWHERMAAFDEVDAWRADEDNAYRYGSVLGPSDDDMALASMRDPDEPDHYPSRDALLRAAGDWSQQQQHYVSGWRHQDVAPYPRGTDMTAPKSAEQLQAELELAQAKLAAIQANAPAGRWPAEPPADTVIRFERTFPPRVTRGIEPEPPQTYTYVALNTGVGDEPWYVTGQRGRERMSWAALTTKIGDSALCEIATEWFTVPALEGPAEPETINVQQYLAEFFARPEPAPVDLDTPGGS